MRNFLQHFLRAGALDCTNATLGAVSVLFHFYLLATHFCGFSADLHELPAIFTAAEADLKA